MRYVQPEVSFKSATFMVRHIHKLLMWNRYFNIAQSVKISARWLSEIQFKVYSKITVSGRLDRTLVTDIEHTGSRTSLCFARVHNILTIQYNAVSRLFMYFIVVKVKISL
jgi:hypothetical protein